MFERFSVAGRAIVSDGIAEAKKLGATSVGPEHLLIAVAGRGGIPWPISWPACDVSGRMTFRAEDKPPPRPIRAEDLRRALAEDDPEAAALAAIGISLPDVRQALEATFGANALTCDGRLPFRADTKRALELSLREAVALRRKKIGSSELLLGLLREPSTASELLARFDVDGAALYQRLRESHAQLGAALI